MNSVILASGRFMARRGDPCLFIIMLGLQERHLYQRRKSNNTCFFKVNDIFL